MVAEIRIIAKRTKILAKVIQGYPLPQNRKCPFGNPSLDLEQHIPSSDARAILNTDHILILKLTTR